MRFERIAAVSLCMMLPLGAAHAATSWTVTDGTLVYGYNTLDDSPIPSIGWVDVVGPSNYATDRIVATRNGANITFELFTNYQLPFPAGPGFSLFPTADFAIDLDLDGIYELGVGLRDHGAIVAGGLYDTSGAGDWLTSLQVAPDGEFLIGGRYANCSGPDCPADPDPEPQPIVLIADTANFIAQYSVSQALNNVDTTSTYITTIALIGVNANGEWNDDFGILWGTSTCGNDTIQGTVVPVPAALPLFVSALGVFALIRRKPARG